MYRGKGSISPAHLGLHLVRQFPRWLRQAFRLVVLADTAFGSVDFLKGLRKLKLHAITGVRYDRLLQDGRQLFHLHKPGQQVRLQGLDFLVIVAWFYLKREKGKPRLKRYVLSTKPLKASTMGGIVGRSKAGSRQRNTALGCIALVNQPGWVYITGWCCR
ncbi:hypothetical protein [Trichocoleus sp. FACHB-591]|uniref:hypothetical protein n=1 Tax=Trichocoleus sp. FACHB-591 TaxID=2692872 RepID=UPI00351C8C0D